MRTVMWTILAVALSATVAQAGPAFDLEHGVSVLSPIQYEHLAIFPIIRTGSVPSNTTHYLTLTEGLQRKLVDVAEDPSGAQVNQVTVKNNSSQPLLLLGGEVILGGQQDRIVGQDTIVEAKGTAPIEVFCVEHGRWDGDGHFASTGGMAEGRVRMSAKYKQDQGAVWDEVAQRNESLGATNATGTYRALAVGAEGEKAIQPFKTAVGQALANLPEAKSLVGLAAALNGKIVSVDVFASPELFKAYRDGLLHSIFVSAASTAPTESPAAAPAPAAVGTFVHDAEAAPEETIAQTSKTRTALKRSKDVARSAVMDKDSDAPAPVYRSYQFSH